MLAGQTEAVEPTDDHRIHAKVHQPAADDALVAEHLAEHYGYLQSGMAGGAPGMPAAGMPPMHSGPAQATPPGIETAGEAQLAGAAGRVS